MQHLLKITEMSVLCFHWWKTIPHKFKISKPLPAEFLVFYGQSCCIMFYFPSFFPGEMHLHVNLYSYSLLHVLLVRDCLSLFKSSFLSFYLMIFYLFLFIYFVLLHWTRNPNKNIITSCGNSLSLSLFFKRNFISSAFG